MKNLIKVHSNIAETETPKDSTEKNPYHTPFIAFSGISLMEIFVALTDSTLTESFAIFSVVFGAVFAILFTLVFLILLRSSSDHEDFKRDRLIAYCLGWIASGFILLLTSLAVGSSSTIILVSVLAIMFLIYLGLWIYSLANLNFSKKLTWKEKIYNLIQIVLFLGFISAYYMVFWLLTNYGWMVIFGIIAVAILYGIWLYRLKPEARTKAYFFSFLISAITSLITIQFGLTWLFLCIISLGFLALWIINKLSIKNKTLAK